MNYKHGKHLCKAMEKYILKFIMKKVNAIFICQSDR